MDHGVPRHDVPAGGRSGFAVVDGRQVHLLSWGSLRAPAVVCLHGGGQTAYMWEDLGTALADRFLVVAPDLPGHGDSDPIEPMDRHAIAATLPPLLDHLGLDRVALVGASLGGIVSITLGAAHPARVAGVVLVDIGHRLEEEGVLRIIEFMRKHESFASLEDAAAAIREYLPHRTDVTPARLTRNLRQRSDGRWEWKHVYGRTMRAEGGEDRARNWQSLLEGVEDDARSLRCPALVLRGAASDVLSNEAAEEMASIIPDARLETVEKAGHLAAGDNPHSTVRLVGAFLDGFAGSL
ncbi:MAG TPA: alpha/beta hydrolase [Acidimicrobiia bacterium]|nr:alpha/beta hydrolase [Acidimicrobiia bacterium]